MKAMLFVVGAALTAVLVPSGTPASAQDIGFASHAELMSVLERQNQRIAELEAHAGDAPHHGGHHDGQHAAAGCCGDGCGGCGSDCCTGCCDPCLRSSGIVGGAEMTFLRPHHSMGIRGADNTDLEFDFEISPRLWVGWQGSDGLGVRMRWWMFDHTASGTSNVAGRTDSVTFDTYLIDLEVFDTTRLGCNWDATVSAGFRYVEFAEERVSRTNVDGAIANAHNFDSWGNGLTVAGELRRCVGDNSALFVNTRGSVLYGDDKEFAGPTFTLVDEEFDDVKFIWEAQAGVQWTMPLDDGGYLFSRAAGEVQFWDNFSGEPFFDGGESVGFGGFAFSVGIVR